MTDSATCTLYLIRHGATANNLANPPLLQGCGVNGSLSDEGRRQADRVGEFLSTQPITAVYSSPMKRAFETAQAVASRHSLTPQTIDAITEIDVGDWEGRSWVEIRETEPEAYQRFITDCGTHGYAGGENLQQVTDRVVPAIEQAMRSHPGESIAVVAHNVVNRVFLADLMGLPVPQARLLYQDNCGINVATMKDGQMKLLTMNAAFHLK